MPESAVEEKSIYFQRYLIGNAQYKFFNPEKQVQLPFLVALGTFGMSNLSTYVIVIHLLIYREVSSKVV